MTVSSKAEYLVRQNLCRLSLIEGVSAQPSRAHLHPAQKARRSSARADSACSSSRFSSMNREQMPSTLVRYTRTSSRRYCGSRHRNGADGRSLTRATDGGQRLVLKKHHPRYSSERSSREIRHVCWNHATTQLMRHGLR